MIYVRDCRRAVETWNVALYSVQTVTYRRLRLKFDALNFMMRPSMAAPSIRLDGKAA